MAVQVQGAQQKKDDELMGMLTKVGSDMLMKKVGGAMGGAGAKTDETHISNGVYSGSDSNPRDRRMNKGY